MSHSRASRGNGDAEISRARGRSNLGHERIDGTAIRRYHLAMAYKRARDDDKAAKTLSAALKLDPNLPEARVATQMLAESRHVAVMRMCQMAQQMGANAILAMRFDCNEIAQTMSEVAAYGTAVIVRKTEPPKLPETKPVPDEDDANDS